MNNVCFFFIMIPPFIFSVSFSLYIFRRLLGKIVPDITLKKRKIVQLSVNGRLHEKEKILFLFLIIHDILCFVNSISDFFSTYCKYFISSQIKTFRQNTLSYILGWMIFIRCLKEKIFIKQL